jgi:hypothetical protein
MTVLMKPVKVKGADMLKPGDIIKDNDLRCEGRFLEIIEIIGDVAHCLPTRHGDRITKIKLNRIYTDGKTRRSGFDLVEG